MRTRRSRVIAAIGILLALASCTTASPPPDRYAIIQTAVVGSQSAAQAFGLVYQTQKISDPVAWGKRYDLAVLAYQGSQLVILTAINEASISTSGSGACSMPASWQTLRDQASVKFETLAGPR